MTGGGVFSNADHLCTLSEEQRDGNKDREVAHKSRIKGLVRNIKGADKRLLIRAKRTGAWMNVRGTIVSGTLLSATEFRDFYVLVYHPNPTKSILIVGLENLDTGKVFGALHGLGVTLGTTSPNAIG